MSPYITNISYHKKKERKYIILDYRYCIASNKQKFYKPYARGLKIRCIPRNIYVDKKILLVSTFTYSIVGELLNVMLRDENNNVIFHFYIWKPPLKFFFTIFKKKFYGGLLKTLLIL